MLTSIVRGGGAGAGQGATPPTAPTKAKDSTKRQTMKTETCNGHGHRTTDITDPNSPRIHSHSGSRESAECASGPGCQKKGGTGVGVEVRGLWFVRYERERACCMVMWLWGSGAGRRAGIRFVTVAVADTGGRYLKSVPLNNKN